jgi:hypothetical protein
VIKNALGQVGQVENVDILPNDVMPFGNLAQAALVEMESAKKAKAVIGTLNDFPFMISGVPRPVRAKAAWPELFRDRPTRPGKRPIEFRWVNPLDPDSDNIKKLELMAKRHQAERIALIKVMCSLSLIQFTSRLFVFLFDQINEIVVTFDLVQKKSIRHISTYSSSVLVSVTRLEWRTVYLMSVENCIGNLVLGRDPLTMGYFDNLDNGLLNKFKKIS